MVNGQMSASLTPAHIRSLGWLRSVGSLFTVTPGGTDGPVANDNGGNMTATGANDIVAAFKRGDLP